MTLAEIALLLGAGFGAGVANAVAGGGTFLTFGALSLIGVPPILANTTSAFASYPGYVTATLGYRGELREIWRTAWPLLLVSAAGGVLGALILLRLGADGFAPLVPWLLLGATLLFWAGPAISRWLKSRSLAAPRPVAWGLHGLVSVYGSFFGAGGGILMLASLSLTEGDDYHRLNAVKLASSVVIATIAIAIFMQGDLLAWGPGLVMMAAVGAGGWAGVRLARRLPQRLIRGVVIAIGLALSARYFLA